MKVPSVQRGAAAGCRPVIQTRVTRSFARMRLHKCGCKATHARAWGGALYSCTACFNICSVDPRLLFKKIGGGGDLRILGHASV